MCCDDPCKVRRCHACPETDWGSFTFRADHPAAAQSLIWSTVERRFDAVSTAMTYPGNCPCAWAHYRGDWGRDITGSYHDDTLFFPIASISRLESVRLQGGYRWQYSISRYSWDWTYWNGLGFTTANGWNWNPDEGPGHENNCEYFGWGFGRFGWGGWGASSWAYGYDPGYWFVPNGQRAVYDLVGGFNCRGTSHFVRNDLAYASQPEYNGNAFPAFVDVTRIPRDTVLA